MARIAKVRLDAAIGKALDYVIPTGWADRIAVGTVVEVPLGGGRRRGIVVGLADRSSVPHLREIEGLVGETSALPCALLELAEWMAEYYLAPIEQVMRTVLPGAVRRVGADFKSAHTWRLAPDAPIGKALESLKRRRPKQAAALTRLDPQRVYTPSQLVAATAVGPGILTALRKAGWLLKADTTLERDPFEDQAILPTEPLFLYPEQRVALEHILSTMEPNTTGPRVTLLLGVTGSGKTEVYLQAIAQARTRGRGVIMLVPEIALTPQTVDRFRSRFGAEIAVQHSHLSSGERHDQWHRIVRGEARIVVGARSALFAPVRDLGLIVVDEEHEPGYKQSESPRYHARDVAVMRGHLEGCAVVLGSATSSLESYRNALSGKYGFVRLTCRVDNRQMPVVRVVDQRLEVREGKGLPTLSGDLVAAIRARLDRSEQVMLFLNRRGYAIALQCPRCGTVLECSHCSVSLTYHRAQEKLCCHLCGRERRVPQRCAAPECAGQELRQVGCGTQRIEEIVNRLFPRARIARLDSDNTRRKQAYAEILGGFRAGEIDMLIGTQMIAKGLHFPNVTLVGVIQADAALHLPDFRAGERTFQLLTQVAGRSGRGDVQGEVIIQTFSPFHPAVQAARTAAFEAFAAEELAVREALQYPPYYRLVCVTLRGQDEKQTEASARQFRETIVPLLPAVACLEGPAPAPIARIRNAFRFQLILRAPRAAHLTGPLRLTRERWRPPAGIFCAIDVDAIDLL